MVCVNSPGLSAQGLHFRCELGGIEMLNDLDLASGICHF
jgi:hypothetical protein